jgi:hypothetical protein
VGRRFESFFRLRRDSSADRATVLEAQVRILHTPEKRGSSVVEHYTVNVEKEVSRFFKNGDHN